MFYEEDDDDGEAELEDWVSYDGHIVPAEIFVVFSMNLKGRALKCYQDLNEEIRNNWKNVKTLFATGVYREEVRPSTLKKLHDSRKGIYRNAAEESKYIIANALASLTTDHKAALETENSRNTF